MNRLVEEDPEAENEVEQTNPYTGRPYSQNYFKLLQGRTKLPVYQFKDEVLKSIRENRVTIIEGSTGSGKTTQIPQFILETDLLREGKKLICTQPRRVAAINVATRVAQEMDVALGDVVGYCVRFDSKESEKTKLKYMTDGLLIREFIADPNINGYDVVIIDEAHERTINSDIIIGLLKELVKRRDDLHVVVMSATLEASKFTDFYNDAPHLVVPGRLFPVDKIYTDESVQNYLDAAVTTVLKIHNEEPEGDILLFLTGEEEIETTCERLRDQSSGRNHKNGMSTLVLPLYASLPPKEQQRVFTPAPRPNQRKIVVATNIAETSVTIDGIVYVVDPGFVKQSQYNPDRRMYSLLVTPISQAAADQRAGRAGRTRPGKCYRLYTEASYNQTLPPQTVPEIKRADLCSVILTMLATGIKDLVHFPFIDPPPMTQMASALAELLNLGALDEEANLTETGRLIAMLPVEPKHAKALIASNKFGCTNEMATLVAILAEQGQVFMRSREKQRDVNVIHAQFQSGYGDHISLINVYDAFVENRSDKAWCEENCVNYKFLARAERSRGQLVSLLRRLNVEIVSVPRSNPDREKLILRGLLEGLFMQTAMLNQTSGHYLFVMSTKEASIHPASCLHRKKPEWVVYSEYIFTNKDYIRCVSEINPEWLFEASPSFFQLENFPDGQVKMSLSSLKNNVDYKNRFK